MSRLRSAPVAFSPAGRCCRDWYCGGASRSQVHLDRRRTNHRLRYPTCDYDQNRTDSIGRILCGRHHAFRYRLRVQHVHITSTGTIAPHTRALLGFRLGSLLAFGRLLLGLGELEPSRDNIIHVDQILRMFLSLLGEIAASKSFGKEAAGGGSFREGTDVTLPFENPSADGGASGRQNRCFYPDSNCSDKRDSFIRTSGSEKTGCWLDLS